MSTIAKRMEKMRYEEPAPKFSRREKQILALLLEGMSNKEMAAAGMLTEKNAERIMARVSQRLDVHLGTNKSRVQIALWVARHPESIGLPNPPMLKELVGFVYAYQAARCSGDYAGLDDRAIELLDRAKAIVA